MTHDDLAREILERIRRCLPEGGPFALHEPSFEGNEWTYLKRCLDSGWVSSAGALRRRVRGEARRADRRAPRRRDGERHRRAARMPEARRRRGGRRGDRAGADVRGDRQRRELLRRRAAFRRRRAGDARTGRRQARRASRAGGGGQEGRLLQRGHRPAYPRRRAHAYLRPSRRPRRPRAGVPGFRAGAGGGRGRVAGIALPGRAHRDARRAGRALLQRQQDRDHRRRRRGDHRLAGARARGAASHDDRARRRAAGSSFTTRSATTTACPTSTPRSGSPSSSCCPCCSAASRRSRRATSGNSRSSAGARMFEAPDFADSNYWLNTLILDADDAAQRDAVLDVPERERHRGPPRVAPHAPAAHVPGLPAHAPRCRRKPGAADHQRAEQRAPRAADA